MTEINISEENANETLQNNEISDNVEINEAETGGDFEEVDLTNTTPDEVDYAALIVEDVKELKREFYELSGLSDITELENPLRYAELRDLGLSPREAYLATRKRHSDNRSHLRSIHNVKSTHQNTMSDSEMAHARELFGDISDAEIRKLYKRVTK